MKMREVMKHDRARTQFAKINAFGVLMLSRQRLRSSFIESSYVACPHCMGAGVVPSIQTASIILFRHLQEKLLAKAAQKIIMTVPTDIAIYILNHKRTELNAMESEFGTEIVIVGDDSLMNIDQYSIQRVAPEQAKTDDLLMANAPSTDAKKKNAQHTEAKKTTMNAPHRTRKRQNQKGQKKSLWHKLVG
jgi:ribonuclease E